MMMMMMMMMMMIFMLGYECPLGFMSCFTMVSRVWRKKQTFEKRLFLALWGTGVRELLVNFRHFGSD